MSTSIYESHNPEVGNVLKDIISGKIGLPDLQRPFVWKNDKARDLLDSMMRGFPIGYIMLWDYPPDDTSEKSTIGELQKDYETPKSLVIDGQQRLTSLLSSFYGVEVMDKDYKKRVIRIAYDPITREFKNADAATERDARFVPSIAEVFAADSEHRISKYRRKFVERLNESNRKKDAPELSDEEEDAIESGLNALLDLEKYVLPTLEISEKADVEMVSEVFVRVNSQGQSLKQDDFIMTLLSVYEPELRKRIERFCEDTHKPAPGTSYNQLAQVTPTNVIRATVGVGFHRGRLRYAYEILRGRDLKTRLVSPATRVANFDTFRVALDQVLNLNDWHAYINTLGEAGFINRSQISSDVGLTCCYALYIIGKNEIGLESMRLKRLIKRWYFASAITSYYVGSFETAFETQLNDIQQLGSVEEFEEYFERSTAALMTDDFFEITLPNMLDANDAKGPAWQGFTAAQIILGAKAFFSTVPLSQLLTPGASGTKNQVDKHHIFPDNYLKEHGYLNDRSNRGNFALADYTSNIYISDDPPISYVKRFREEQGEEAYQRTCKDYALPENFEDMDYEEFLPKRRQMMAQLVMRGFEQL